MQSEENDLRQRTKEFALQIVRMFSRLPKTTEAQVLDNRPCDLAHRSEQTTAKPIARVAKLNGGSGDDRHAR
jgi:hypothetical protein